MLRRTPADSEMKPTKTLSEAVDERRSFLSVLGSKAQVSAQEIAKLPSLQILIDRAVQGKLEAAKAKADAAFEELRAENERLRVETEERIAQIRKETAEQRTRIRIELDNALAENERLKKLAEAKRYVQDAQTDVEVTTARQGADRKRKLALAQSPEVRDLLKPFTTKAYYQPNGKSGYKRLGVSLNALRTAGALQPSPKSLQKLLNIGRDKRDKERPRLGYPRYWRNLSPQQKDRLKEIQNRLIELGDVLVELELLSP